MTVRINKQKINLREKLTEFEDKVNFDEVVRGLGEYTGNVGIGTTGTDFKLDVLSDGYKTVKFARSGGTPHLFFANTDDVAADGVQTDCAIFLASNSEFRLSRRAGDNITQDQNVWLAGTSDGNVGIGTTNPAYKFHVADASVANLLIQKTTPGGQVDGITFHSIGDAENSINSRTGDISLIMSSAAGDSEPTLRFSTTNGASSTKHAMFITDGNVGIGTTDPGYELEVIGDINASVNLRAAGSIITSDDRTKHNEQNIVGAIETLGKLTPKKYIKTTEMYEANHDFELDADGNPVDADGEPVEHSIEAGVIAQQVLTVDELAFAVSPEGVDEDGNVTSPHGLNYNSLFTYAIAAIQEQQSIIEDLKSRIETLESK